MSLESVLYIFSSPWTLPCFCLRPPWVMKQEVGGRMKAENDVKHELEGNVKFENGLKGEGGGVKFEHGVKVKNGVKVENGTRIEVLETIKSE